MKTANSKARAVAETGNWPNNMALALTGNNLIPSPDLEGCQVVIRLSNMKTANDSEIRKKLTSILESNPAPCQIVDNVKGDLSSEALAQPTADQLAGSTKTKRGNQKNAHSK